MLRGAYLDEIQVAENYYRAAENRKGELGAQYSGYAQDEKRHAQLLKEIICRAL
jgi:hypothetical protein